MSEDKYHILDPHQEIECPYDKAHMVRARRFPYHLMKCRQNHGGTDYATCPFNARHEVHKPELRHHITNCPDRCRIDLDIVHENQKSNPDNDILKGCTDVPAYNNVPLSKPTEDWDLDLPHAGDRYIHMPVLYKDKISMQGIQQRQIQKYFLDKGKTRPQESAAKATDLKSVAAANPIYSMTMAGVGRGKLLSKLSEQQHAAEINAPGRSAAQELMAAVAMGRGRGANLIKMFQLMAESKKENDALDDTKQTLDEDIHVIAEQFDDIEIIQRQQLTGHSISTEEKPRVSQSLMTAGL